MAIEVTELDWGLLVTGDYGEMKNIIPDLKDLKFKWDAGERAWVKQIKREGLRRETAEAIRDLAKALMQQRTAMKPILFDISGLPVKLGKSDIRALEYFYVERYLAAPLQWAKLPNGKWALKSLVDPRNEDLAVAAFEKWKTKFLADNAPAPRGGKGPSEAQWRILRKITERDWHDMDAGQGTWLPTEAQFAAMSPGQISAIISDYLGGRR